MKKWDQLQLTLDNSKWKAVIRIKHKNCSRQWELELRDMNFSYMHWRGLVREFDLWNVFNEDLYGFGFIECSSYHESTVFMNLIFSLFVVIMLKIGFRDIYLEENVYSICSLKVRFQGRIILKNIKIKTILFHVGFHIFW